MNEQVRGRPDAAGTPADGDGHDLASSGTPPETNILLSPTEFSSDEPPAPGDGAGRPEGEHNDRARILGGIREVVETIVLALLFFFALRAVIQNFRVEGSSMVPSFTDGQYVLVNKAAYAHVDAGSLPGWVPVIGGGSGAARYVFHAPDRGDVIVFHPPPPNDPSRDFIKRVIGVPGDTVDVRQGHVYVNGAELIEPYIRQQTLPINIKFAHVILGPNQYFVLGDNRGNSSDSRAWGPVSSDEIVGRTWVIYWPFDQIKVAPNHAEAVPAPETPPSP